MDFDVLLIRRIKKSDEDAAEIFVRKYYEKIYKYCYIRIGNYGDAQDLVQNTFMKFFESIDRYNHCGKALNYLYVIASNECKDYFRKKKYTMVDIDKNKTNSFSDTYQNKLDSLNEIRKIEEKTEIREAIEKLPDELREVVVLFYFNDMKQRDIAKILEISLSLVKYRISRAKELLEEELKEEV